MTPTELEAQYPGILELLGRHYAGADLAVELERLRPPRWMSPPPATPARAGGVHFDASELDRFLRFAKTLRHIKGRGFAGRPFLPDLWQTVFLLAPLFGWRRADGTRLYRSVYLEVPRKNGKSTLAAAVALYLLTADREPGAEVFSAARDRDQARAVFDLARRMARASPALRRRLNIPRGVHAKTITYEATASTYTVLSSDRGGLAKHGLNVHGCVIDELHVITDRDFVNTLETGTGSRDQPLILAITTAGVPGESLVWEDKRGLSIKVAERALELESHLTVIYAADPAVALDNSWRDPAVWAGANPGLGTSVRVDYLAAQAKTAEASPAELNSFLRLHLGIPSETSAGWLKLAVWDRTASLVDEADLRGARAYGGLDLATSLDIAAFVLIFPDEDDELVDVLCRFWTPADTLARRAHADVADYELWHRQGFLRATPGETINFDAVEADIARDLETFDVRSIDFDPFSSVQLVQHLEELGAPMRSLRQGFLSLSPPFKELTRLAVEKKLRHGGNPVLRWMVSGTKVVEDAAGNQKPDKVRSRNRIDGVAALTDAASGWLRDTGRGRSVYEDRGLEVVGR